MSHIKTQRKIERLNRQAIIGQANAERPQPTPLRRTVLDDVIDAGILPAYQQSAVTLIGLGNTLEWLKAAYPWWVNE